MFFRSKIKNYILGITIMITMMVGGYALGTRIGQKSLDSDMQKHIEKQGYQTMRSTGQNNRGIEHQEISSEEVIAPDTLVIFERYYTICGDKRVEERKAKEHEVGLRREEAKLKFSDWDMDEFSTQRVVFTMEIDDYCPGHFVVRDRDGMVVIYMPSEEGSEFKSIEETGIPTISLPPDIQDEIHKGLSMDSLEDIEHFMENLES